MAHYHSDIALGYIERRIRPGANLMPLSTAKARALIASYKADGLVYWPNPDCDNRRPDGGCAGHTVTLLLGSPGKTTPAGVSTRGGGDMTDLEKEQTLLEKGKARQAVYLEIITGLNKKKLYVRGLYDAGPLGIALIQWGQSRWEVHWFDELQKVEVKP